eukprot:s106_g17.t1
MAAQPSGCGFCSGIEAFVNWATPKKKEKVSSSAFSASVRVSRLNQASFSLPYLLGKASVMQPDRSPKARRKPSDASSRPTLDPWLPLAMLAEELAETPEPEARQNW